MRIAVISDIHGNLAALEAVLDDIDAQRPDALVCLGDLAFKGPQPAECVTRIRELSIPCVHGNTDLYLLHQAGIAPTRPLPAGVVLPEDIVPYLAWHIERLSPADLQFLAGLPFEHRLEADGVKLLFVHANPQDCIAAIRPTDPSDAVAAKVKEMGADWLITGHIHTPFLFRHGGKLLINPGAVGFSLDYDWRAAWALLDTQQGTVELHRVEYDRAAAVAAARERAFPFDWKWYAEVLETGFWTLLPFQERLKSHGPRR